ncbi:MAG: tRNA (N(6)-L-threonylcarbamoyladenosine(37)-C(2))-methylthiotransferase MtaB [Planctomycetia bacterium]|nr:tRNA (N(6)-L-threonylcarbamoyladenosine(37)-C(2))-methylthiotransferase MtaB [Planctomycetia bacterium]
MRFQTATLGCKVNQYETQYIRQALLDAGWQECDDDKSLVDYVIVNTCAVTSESDAKSRKLVAHWHKQCPQAKIIVLGCSATLHPATFEQLKGVERIQTDKRHLDHLLHSLNVPPPKNGIRSFDERHRAYVKIQDGCRVGCAYCIIPTVRPYLHSRTPDDVLTEMTSLAQNGFRELVLTGIHLGHYGLDFHARGSETSLTDFLALREEKIGRDHSFLAMLLERILASNLPVRVRLGSLEAVEVTPDLLDVLASHQEVLCPQLHLSMQSGDDSVLSRMKRRWPAAAYREKCEQIKERIPTIALTTDVIVGFPGETDSQFQNTCDLCQRIGFAKIHLFRFSARPGTLAAAMPNQISPQVKKERLAHLNSIANELRTQYAKNFIGQKVQILVEDSADSCVLGTTQHYLPATITPAPDSQAVPLPCPGTLVDTIPHSWNANSDQLESHCLIPQ